MIITKSKHNKIVSMKNADIVRLENVIELKDKEINCRKEVSNELIEDCKKFKDELHQASETIKDNEIAIDLLVDKVEELEHENEELADKLLSMREDLVEAYKEIDIYKKDRERIDELKRQYDWHIKNAIKCHMISPLMTDKDVKRMIGIDGRKCILEFHQLFSLL